MEIRQLPIQFQKGFKINYTKMKKTIMKCEINEDKDECKKLFREMGLEIVE
jgi:hypothetical protein